MEGMSMMDSDNLNPRRQQAQRNLAEQAADWLLVLEDDEPQARSAFAAWVAQSPLHVEAFLRAATLDSLLSRVDPGRSIAIERGTVSTNEPDIAGADLANA